MLEPVRVTGSKPPFFLIHGLYGLMPMGKYFLGFMNPEQPFYGIVPPGYDGAYPAYQTVREMAIDYVREIRAVISDGPCIVGGLCPGSMAAIEVARMLMASGTRVGTVLMIDPPSIPFGHDPNWQHEDPRRNPRLAKILYNHTIAEIRKLCDRFEYRPFDLDDEKQRHHVAMIAMLCVSAFASYRPDPFDGSTEAIVCSRRATAQFDPRMPWPQALRGPRIVHVVDGDHSAVFSKHLITTSKLVATAVDRAFETDAPVDPFLSKDKAIDVDENRPPSSAAGVEQSV